MIGERLLELRKDADLTQDDLAAILHINKHSISSYERDKSEPPMLSRSPSLSISTYRLIISWD